MTTIQPNHDVRLHRVPNCYMCKERGLTLFPHLRDRLFDAPGVWSLLACPACGFVWLDPKPNAEDVGVLYANYYTHRDPAERLPGPLARWLKLAILTAAFGYDDVPATPPRALAGRLLSLLGPLRDAAGASVMWLHRSQRGRLLDVGCGNGELVARLSELGWDALGIEPDPAAVQQGRALNRPVSLGSLEEGRFPDGTFDVVTMTHVIEHLPDPVATLAECRRVLRVGGRVVVLTPNVQSLARKWFGVSWLHWDPPRHLALFSLRTLATCADRAGLHVRDLRTTARQARATWYASSEIRETGVLPEGRLDRVPWWVGVQGLLFWTAESLLTKVRPWGEEILMTAIKETR